jgi:hypothetical protein
MFRCAVYRRGAFVAAAKSTHAHFLLFYGTMSKSTKEKNTVEFCALNVGMVLFVNT